MKMLNRYKIKFIKQYDFALDGKSKNDMESQVKALVNETQILEIPEVKRKVKYKIRQIKERNTKNGQNNKR